MPRCCLKCEKDLTVGKTFTHTKYPDVYEVEIHTLCHICIQIDKIKEQKKAMNQKVRDLTKRQKYLEEIQGRRIRQYYLENEYLDFLKSQK